MDVATVGQVREARVDDHDDIKEITADTWPDREGQDYLGRVYPRWLESGDCPKHTLVVEHEGHAVAIAQAVLLTDEEAWGQGLRVHPDYRGQGLSQQLTAELFSWAAQQGATVVRALVHAWNEAGLGQSRASGYRPAGTFRWVHPAVGTDAVATTHLDHTDRTWLPVPPDATITNDPATAWRAFHGSDGAHVLGGLGLSLDESWALSELTPALLERAADETATIAITTDRGAQAMTYRSRVFEHEPEEGDTETIAEYGAATWNDTGVAAVLLDAVASDANDIGADRIRIAIPDRPLYVSDTALCRADVAESAEVVMAADLTGTVDFASIFEDG